MSERAVPEVHSLILFMVIGKSSGIESSHSSVVSEKSGTPRYTLDFSSYRVHAEYVSQPWFLEVYARYIVSLEQALATLDSLLPSTHSPNQPFSSRTKAKSQSEKDEQRLAHVIMALEERAADEGESGLAICLSKPLMRLGKLPLLMQNLLYQSDAAASFEWEKVSSLSVERELRLMEMWM